MYLQVLKAFPHRITSARHVEKLPFIGPKIGGMIEEFLDTGRIAAARAFTSSEPLPM